MKRIVSVTILILLFVMCFNSCDSDISRLPEETSHYDDAITFDETTTDNTVDETTAREETTEEETTAETTVPEETTSEPSQDYPVIDSIPEEFLAVIKNTEKFILRDYLDGDQEIYLADFRFPYTGALISDCTDVKYAVLDMNGDNKLEVVISGIYGDKLVLHSENGKVYGFDFIFRNMDRIKVDGSFAWNEMTSGGISYGDSKLDFSGSKVTRVVLCSVENDGTDEVKFYIGKESVSKQEYLDYSNTLPNIEVTWFSFDRYFS